MNERSSPSLTDSLHKGWRWWTRELMDFVPGRPRGSEARERKTLVVSLDPSGPRLADERVRSRSTTKANPATTQVADVWDTISSLGKGRRRASVWLRLPYAACFVRRIELPEAARQDAARLLELDLERTTPFRQKDIYTAHYVDEGRSTRQTLHVCQLVVRREEVESAIATLRSTGAALAGVDCWNEDASSSLPVNFLPRAGSQTGALSPRLNRLLLAAALVLTFSAASIAIERHEVALADLTKQTSSAREAAASARRASDDAKAAVNEIEAVRKLKASNTSAVEILDALTRLLPDTAWVSDFRLDGGTLDFSGEAESAAGLISVLENSDLFAQAAFTAPVTRDGRGGKESFSLRVHVEGRYHDKEPAP